jgi:hypothetical protein
MAATGWQQQHDGKSSSNQAAAAAVEATLTISCSMHFTLQHFNDPGTDTNTTRQSRVLLPHVLATDKCCTLYATPGLLTCRRRLLSGHSVIGRRVSTMYCTSSASSRLRMPWSMRCTRSARMAPHTYSGPPSSPACTRQQHVRARSTNSTQGYQWCFPGCN